MPTNQTKRARVLVVDDDPDTRTMIANLLSEAGYETATARSGQEGFKIQCECPADLVVLDMVMPDKDGVETTVQFLRSYPRVPILAVSGAVTRDNLLRAAEQLGASRTLSKPFLPDELLKAVEELLGFK